MIVVFHDYMIAVSMNENTCIRGLRGHYTRKMKRKLFTMINNMCIIHVSNTVMFQSCLNRISVLSLSCECFPYHGVLFITGPPYYCMGTKL